MATREQKAWQHLQANEMMRQAHKRVRNRHQPGHVRHKDWTSDYLADPDVFEELDVPDLERVVPRGENERRQDWAKALPRLQEDYNPPTITVSSSEAHPTHFDPESWIGSRSQMEGTVIEVSAGLCRVELPDRIVMCNLRTSLREADRNFTNAVAAGDRVLLSLNSSERGIVEAVLPRHSALIRPDVFYPHLQQVIVANVDQLLVVASWREPALWFELLDRYLIAAERNRLSPIICVNKIDLADDAAAPRAALAPYTMSGYRVLYTSARACAGLDELAQLLHGRTTALAGLSGVGKSSLLTAIEPALQPRIREVSARRHEGRHTTTQVTLHPLAAGGFVVDTPGIREFGLSGLRRDNLIGFYPEMTALAGGCRFPNCSHIREPGCAVRLAVRDGRVASVRYENYKKIYRSLPA